MEIKAGFYLDHSQQGKEPAVVTTMDPKLTGRRNLGKPAATSQSPQDVASDRHPTTVVGRDLQVLRDVLSLHIPEGRAADARAFTVPEGGNAPSIRQAAVKAAGSRFLQLYVCTPLEADIDQTEAPKASAPDGRAHPFYAFDVRRIWRYLLRQRELRRQRDQLTSMPDYMLRDIGIESRTEIAGLLRNHSYGR
jgi:uncharacterized protein YjiS (DUF1127 family)